MKKVLVIGSGGREHALCWKISENPDVKKIYAAPGNGGTSLEDKVENVPIKSDDIESLLDFAINNSIDFTVVGPENPLVSGIVDLFESHNLRIFGPNKDAAKLEGSKSFSKEIMKSANIPTAEYMEFTDYADALSYVRKKGAPLVIKADGLAAGKGVTVALDMSLCEQALHEIFVDRLFCDAGNKVVIEEYLVGEEASFLCFTDGETIVPMLASQDHKAIGNGDVGANTGGMGAYTPAPILPERLQEKALNTVAKPLIKELKRRGITYKGIIYAGLMISKNDDIDVLEFNCRFGDPEAQPLLMCIETDLLSIMEACSSGNLHDIDISWRDGSSVCVVLASGGYPGSYKNGYEILGADYGDKDLKVFHAGTKLDDGKLVTDGGRVLGITSFDKDLKKAIEKAYEACKNISFEGAYRRDDIGQKALGGE